MTELLLHMNNYFITETITAYQTYPKKKEKQEKQQRVHGSEQMKNRNKNTEEAPNLF